MRSTNSSIELHPQRRQLNPPIWNIPQKHPSIAVVGCMVRATLSLSCCAACVELNLEAEGRENTTA